MSKPRVFVSSVEKDRELIDCLSEFSSECITMCIYIRACVPEGRSVNSPAFQRRVWNLDICLWDEGADLVAKICNLLYRRIVFGWPRVFSVGPGVSPTPQIKNLRNSRVQLCATPLPDHRESVCDLGDSKFRHQQAFGAYSQLMPNLKNVQTPGPAFQSKACPPNTRNNCAKNCNRWLQNWRSCGRCRGPQRFFCRKRTQRTQSRHRK